MNSLKTMLNRQEIAWSVCEKSLGKKVDLTQKLLTTIFQNVFFRWFAMKTVLILRITVSCPGSFLIKRPLIKTHVTLHTMSCTGADQNSVLTLFPGCRYLKRKRHYFEVRPSVTLFQAWLFLSIIDSVIEFPAHFKSHYFEVTLFRLSRDKLFTQTTLFQGDTISRDSCSESLQSSRKNNSISLRTGVFCKYPSSRDDQTPYVYDFS